MGALRYVDQPSYRALLLRRTFPELLRSLIPKSFVRYAGVGGRPVMSSQPHWQFPSGAVIEFSHLQHEHDVHKYQSAEYQYIGFDELTSFTEKQYEYMLSRLRTTAGIPCRVRAGTNPGGEGHEWVMRRWAPWLDPESKVKAQPGQKLHYVNTDDGPAWAESGLVGALSRVFFPAKVSDNPHLNDGYEQVLRGMDRVTRAQLLDGNWLAKPAAGEYFRRGWFKYVTAAPARARKRVRAWDLASTDNGGDWTVGVLLSCTDRMWCVEDVVRTRQRPSGVEATVLATAKLDPPGTEVRIPQDPGQAGKAQAEAYTRLLAGYSVHAKPVTGDKVTRAKPASAQVEAGNVSMVEAPWNRPFLEILEAFPTDGVHDDDVDAFADAFNATLQPATAQMFDLGPMPGRRM
jgi:predicted phage terminase large subunit-like protein